MLKQKLAEHQLAAAVAADPFVQPFLLCFHMSWIQGKRESSHLQKAHHSFRRGFNIDCMHGHVSTASQVC